MLIETITAPRDKDGFLPPWLRWAIAITASLGALLEIVDTSIVNVALNHIQGNLGATLSEVGWVVTGYAVANVIIIPLSAWLGDYFGQKNYFIFSLIGFVVASMLCGLSTSLGMLIFSRVLQGLTGGGLLAKAQAILFETFPKKDQPLAQSVFGLTVIMGPAIGPTLGGFITDNIGWRWIFFINLPIGIIAILAAMVFLQKDKINHAFNRKVDWLGIFLLTVGLSAFQTMLEEGQQDDWFNSPFIITMAIVSVIGIALFIWQELTIDHPAVDLRVLRHRSLAAGSVYSVILGIGLYGALFAIPIFTQTMLNFTAEQTGWLLFPGALASGVMMILSGQLARFIDPRILIGVGSIILALTMFHLAGINPNTSADSLFWPMIWRGVGTVMMFMPLSIATFSLIPQKDIASASGFFNLTRQIGGSIGIAILTTLLSQRENLHRTMLVEKVNIYNPAFQHQVQSVAAGLQARGVEATTAKSQAMMVIDRMVDMQSAIMSFGDIFWIVGVMFIVSLVLLLFMGSKNPASKDAPIDAH